MHERIYRAASWGVIIHIKKEIKMMISSVTTNLSIAHSFEFECLVWASYDILDRVLVTCKDRNKVVELKRIPHIMLCVVTYYMV